MDGSFYALQLSNTDMVLQFENSEKFTKQIPYIRYETKEELQDNKLTKETSLSKVKAYPFVSLVFTVEKGKLIDL